MRSDTPTSCSRSPLADDFRRTWQQGNNLHPPLLNSTVECQPTSTCSTVWPPLVKREQLEIAIPPLPRRQIELFQPTSISLSKAGSSSLTLLPSQRVVIEKGCRKPKAFRHPRSQTQFVSFYFPTSNPNAFNCVCTASKTASPNVAAAAGAFFAASFFCSAR